MRCKKNVVFRIISLKATNEVRIPFVYFQKTIHYCSHFPFPSQRKGWSLYGSIIRTFESKQRPSPVAHLSLDLLASENAPKRTEPEIWFVGTFFVSNALCLCDFLLSPRRRPE
ncbi:hypothetical protein CEXT_745821 [Caerostris extrusa]|uniref:Uncharacterized protein n=1 Tax=Caerostris extrusa TaxID=172846 RepID=A0AAV4R085_CAEEX|nr:hypothetical protein CEXT_745821 [Caerostris extrusa]